jgi:hypothetical protein
MEIHMETTESQKNPVAAKYPDLEGVLNKIDWTLDGEPTPGKSYLSLLGELGDTKHIWDKNKPEEVEAARALFDALLKKGYLAFHVVKEGEPGKPMAEFDPNAERLIMSKQPIGG